MLLVLFAGHDRALQNLRRTAAGLFVTGDEGLMTQDKIDESDPLDPWPKLKLEPQKTDTSIPNIDVIGTIAQTPLNVAPASCGEHQSQSPGHCRDGEHRDDKPPATAFQNPCAVARSKVVRWRWRRKA